MADFLKMDEVLEHLDLKNSMTAAEFGCGSAHFTLLLAKHLDKGRVYALDIQESKLSALNGKIKQQRATNIITITCDLEQKNGSTLKDHSLDIVLIPNLLFQAEDKDAIIREAHRVLRPQGQLLVIDWIKSNPLNTGRVVKPEEVKTMAQKAGFSFKKEFISGDYHYGLLFIK